MSVSPPNTHRGNASIRLTSGVATRDLSATWGGAAWPANYVEASTISVTVADTPTGVGPPSAFVLLVVVEDAFDVAGNYVTTTGGSTLSTGVLAILNLGSNPAAGTYTIGNGLNGAGGADTRNAALSKFGTFRILISTGDTLNSALRVADGGGVGAYHHDTDVNDASGTGNLVNASLQVTGVGGVKCKLTAQSRTAGNWKYPQQITASFTLKSVIDSTSAPYTNAALKNVKVGWTKIANPAAVDIVKKQSITLSTLGVVAVPATNIDTDWGQTVGGDSFFTEIAVGQNFGDVATPANEKAAIYAIGTTDAADNEQMAYVFANVAQVSPYVNSSDTNRRLRTNTADQLASAAIQAFSDSGTTTAGVGVFSDNTFVTNKVLWARRPVSGTFDDTPNFQAFLTDAYGTKLDTISIITSELTVGNVTEATQAAANTGTGGTAGRMRFSYQIGASDAAFNRFKLSAVDDPNAPPATFIGVDAALHPAYAKNVKFLGNAFGGVKEPSVTSTSQYGVNSEIIIADIFCCQSPQNTIDANGAPTGTSATVFALGTGTVRFKPSSTIGANLKLVSLAAVVFKTVDGQTISVAVNSMLTRNGGWDVTNNVSQLGMASGVSANNDPGYNSGTNNGFDALTLPTDAKTVNLIVGFSQTTAVRNSLTMNGDPSPNSTTVWAIGQTPNGNVGFSTDNNTYGYYVTRLIFNTVNPNLVIIVTSDKTTIAPVDSVRINAKFMQRTGDGTLVPAAADIGSVRYYLTEQEGVGVPPVAINPSGTAMTDISGGALTDFESIIASGTFVAGKTYTVIVIGTVVLSLPLQASTVILTVPPNEVAGRRWHTTN